MSIRRGIAWWFVWITPAYGGLPFVICTPAHPKAALIRVPAKPTPRPLPRNAMGRKCSWP